MEKNLKLWIAQAESWHTFVDFKLPEEAIAKYPFLERHDDFYIALFAKIFDLISDPDFENKKAELLAIGKGLEIYSLENTRKKFRGINYYENILYAASLYYLADYSASAWLLANLFPLDKYILEIDKFISCFLRRDTNVDISYASQLKTYLLSGDTTILDDMLEIFSQKTMDAFRDSPHEYTSYKLAYYLINHFYKNNIWIDLLGQNQYTKKEWEKYVDVNLKRQPPVWDFFPSQRDAINKGILKEDKTFSFQMPTSAGKTALCELIIYNEKIRNPNTKILFLAPFRALASELKSGFSKKLAELGIKSKTIYGGNIATQDERDSIHKVDLLISTPEKFMAVESLIPNIYDLFQVIICDEGHLLDNEQRGLSYELLLSKFRSTTGSKKKFIFLSAIIPNIEEINSWLGGNESSLVKSEYRPTELSFAFLKEKSKDNYYLDVNPTQKRPENYQLYKFLSKEDFQYINPITRRRRTYTFNNIKTLAVATALKAVPSGTVALFTPQKGKRGVTELADELIEQVQKLRLPKPIDFSDKAKISELKEYFEKLFGNEYLLTTLIEYGTAFHHGDLPQDVREVIEDALRDGTIRLVICTNTLAEGVNLPIRTIVIHSTKRFDYESGRLVDMDIRDLKNIMGRAGRACKETKGLIIITNPEDFNNATKVIKNEGSNNVTGFLYKIVQAIDKFIREKRLILSNEIFEQQAEWFKQLIDSIDISLLSLMAEEITPEQLAEQINTLVKQTFAFQQATTDEQRVLEKIFNLRGEVVKPYVVSKEYKAIKQSGASIRLYKHVLELFNFEDEVWTSTNDPLAEDWLQIIKKCLSELPQIKSKIDEFNKFNIKVTPDNIIQIIKLWIDGNTYKNISNQTQVEVNTILKLFSSLIGFQIQSIVSNIVRIAESKLLERDRHLSETLFYWPQFLLYGLKNRLQLDLIDLGSTNRLGIIALSEVIQKEGFTYSEIEKLRLFIKQNHTRLLEEIKPLVPVIVYKKTDEEFKYISSRNIY